MPTNSGYNRYAAVAYGHQWAHGRNPDYLDFTGLGGDCTNFISQCLYAGSDIMNHTPVYGWFYRTAYDRTASWTGVQYLYNFLTSNREIGPYARQAGIHQLEIGDVIQLCNENGVFYHSLLVVQARQPANRENVLICTHTDDSDWRPLSSYHYASCRFIHILGVRRP